MSTTSIETTVQEFLKSFDLLAEDEQRRVAKEILLRSMELKSAVTDEELVLNAEQVFLELDSRESENGQS